MLKMFSLLLINLSNSIQRYTSFRSQDKANLETDLFIFCVSLLPASQD